MSIDAARTRTLHLKRSFGKHPRVIDSPAYDAHVASLFSFHRNTHTRVHRSEEDNDQALTDDGSAVSGPESSRPAQPLRQKTQQAKMKHHLAASVLSDSDRVDSPTYDGDVESSTVGGYTDTQPHPRASTLTHHYSSSTSTFSNPYTSEAPDNFTPGVDAPSTDPLSVARVPRVPAAVQAVFNPAALTPEDIQSFVRKAIEGESWRNYKINPPPAGRPIRIYADGASLALPKF
jgi:choline-phosphate cytidylyltransferase